eukprot:TRINITY_DN15848_c0_g1_i1.p1 TRINITY_DN15848_c0_g1~~TRINITY_DN15848_c0_g1_i1.p1  ORF type:complete len:836 (+),score=127.22 TRINITY_DN15848_c0_g1_i1:148-2655(+)
MQHHGMLVWRAPPVRVHRWESYKKSLRVTSCVMRSSWARLLFLQPDVLLQALVVIGYTLTLSEASPSRVPCEGGRRGVIAVVGAGIAGLSAAQTLRRAGCDVVVFEASSKVGGRAHRVVDELSFAGVNTGARWVHGGEHNTPIKRISELFGIRQILVGGDEAFQGPTEGLRVFYNGSLLSEELKDRAFRLFSSLERELQREVLRMLEDTSQDPSVFKVWKTVMRKNQNNYDQMDRILLDWQLSVNVEQTTGVHPTKLSAREFFVAAYNSLSPNNRHERKGDTVLEGGFMSMVERLGEGLDIRLNSPVVQVEHFSSRVRLHVDGPDGIVDAAAAVITASINVLKQGLIKFVPPLPRWWTKSLDKIVMGNVTKILVRFRKGFDPVDRDAYLLSRIVPMDEIALVTYCVCERSVDDLDKLVLDCFANGDAAMMADSLVNSADGREAIVNELGVMFPGLKDDDVEAVHFMTWYGERFVHGAWSEPKIGASSNDFESLARPIGRLRFAGEATCRLMRGCVHGAMVSGADMAYSLLPTRRKAAVSSRAWPLFDSNIRSLCSTRFGASPVAEDQCGTRGSTDDPDHCAAEVVVRDPLLPCRQFFPSLAASVPSLFKAWEGMSTQEQRAWISAGWTAETWPDLAQHKSKCTFEWASIDIEAQENLSSVGFSEQMWSLFRDQYKTVIECRSVPSIFEEWELLRAETRAHWQVLGYSRASFDESVNTPHAATAVWVSLTPRQQEAARSLGYTEKLWNDANVDSRPMSAQLAWDKLSRPVRSDWELLGFNEGLWDDSADDDHLFHERWSELPQEKREAAIRVGYWSDNWPFQEDGEDDSDGVDFTV